MNAKEIREKQTSAIEQELGELRRRLFDLRNQAATEKVEDTSQFRKLRRDIARLKTILLQRQTGAAPAAGPQT
jgi:large subunit ribosomal protein L29